MLIVQGNSSTFPGFHELPPQGNQLIRRLNEMENFLWLNDSFMRKNMFMTLYNFKLHVLNVLINNVLCMKCILCTWLIKKTQTKITFRKLLSNKNVNL